MTFTASSVCAVLWTQIFPPENPGQSRLGVDAASATVAAVDDDAAALAQIRRGDADAFAELVRRHQTLVFSILSRYERDAHLVEDLAQETFLKVWRNLAQFDGRAPFAHWLSRITVHVALDHLRRRKRVRQEIGFEELGPDTLEWLRTDDGDKELSARQAREILVPALATLNAEEQLVLTLQEIEGKTAKEISALTGWSGVSVRVRAFRARAKLKKALTQLECAS